MGEEERNGGEIREMESGSAAWMKPGKPGIKKGDKQQWMRMGEAEGLAKRSLQKAATSEERCTCLLRVKLEIRLSLVTESYGNSRHDRAKAKPSASHLC